MRSVHHGYIFLTQLATGSTVLLRSPRLSEVSIFEKSMGILAEQLGLHVEWCVPAPGGREQTYLRDFAMVTMADRLIALFDWEHPMEGGTAHLVEAAMMRETPVEAWTINAIGELERLGEHEPSFAP